MLNELRESMKLNKLDSVFSKLCFILNSLNVFIKYSEVKKSVSYDFHKIDGYLNELIFLDKTYLEEIYSVDKNLISNHLTKFIEIRNTLEQAKDFVKSYDEKDFKLELFLDKLKSFIDLPYYFGFSLVIGLNELRFDRNGKPLLNINCVSAINDITILKKLLSEIDIKIETTTNLINIVETFCPKLRGIKTNLSISKIKGLFEKVKSDYIESDFPNFQNMLTGHTCNPVVWKSYHGKKANKRQLYAFIMIVFNNPEKPKQIGRLFFTDKENIPISLNKPVKTDPNYTSYLELFGEMIK